MALRIALLAVPIWAQTPPAKNPFTGDPKAIKDGAVLFRQECMYCHGIAARGGMRGPDLTTGAWVHGGSDAELVRTIRDGVTGTAMPPNHLTDDEIWQVIAYLRTQQQPSPPPSPTGDGHRGETLFFGSARCSSCHMVNGRGGRLGPELSHVGSARPRGYLIESIREPNRQLTENFDTVTVVTRDGKTIVGVPMDEDTFTVHIMDASERIHGFEKKSLKSLKHENRSLMPAYDAAALSDADLQDVVAYLQSLRSPSPAAEKGGERAEK